MDRGIERIERVQSGRVSGFAKVTAVVVAMIVFGVIVLAGCAGSPDAARSVTPPPEQHVFYDLSGEYRQTDGSGTTIVISDVGSPDSVYGVATMGDGTTFYVLAGRHGDGALNGTWTGTLVQDQEPDMSAAIVADDISRSTNFTLEITFEGGAVQAMSFAPR